MACGAGSRAGDGAVIYVLQTKRFVKVGYTGNARNRLAQHRSYSIRTYGDFLFLGWVDGDTETEKSLQYPIRYRQAPGVNISGSKSKDWFRRSKFVDQYIASLPLNPPERIGLVADGGHSLSYRKRPIGERAVR